MSKRQQVAEIAQSWLLTPFHHEARVKGHGVDCLQLLVAVYQEAGLVPDDIEVEHYAYDEHLHDPSERYIAALKTGGFIETETPQMGDVVLFRIGRRYSHAAVVLDFPRCIHAYIGHGVAFVDADNDAELAGRPRLFFTVIKDEA